MCSDAASPPGLWANLAKLRENLPGYHQEFEFHQNWILGGARASRRYTVIVDGAGQKWREQSAGLVRVFDGKSLFRFEDDGDEYERPKLRGHGPLSLPYAMGNADWGKAVERERRACGYQGVDRECVLLEAPIQPWARAVAPNATTSVQATGSFARLREGRVRALLDTQTGLLVSAASTEVIEGPRGSYKVDMSVELRRSQFGQAPSANLFRLPERVMSEVKEMARWDAPRIRRQFAGKPAPDFSFVDMAGRPVWLGALRGKFVLLDFWTTWCPPCREDAPALNKLHQKYGDRDLAIIGITVNEERATVEKFLKGHPHDFPVVLSSENEMPRPYDIGVFPTYLVIDREGKLYAAVQGDQGFGELRKLLKKAGLDVD